MARGIQHGIWENRFKTILLVILLPVFLAVVIFGFFYFTGAEYQSSYLNSSYTNYEDETQDALYATGKTFVIFGPLLILWLIIAFSFEKQLIFHYSGARAISRKENPEIYNIVENLCISRGLPTPKIGIIEDEGMNAFALGRQAKNSWICFTRGLLNNLEPREIEAVAGHELTHIINKDTVLMLVMVLYIGAISFIGEVLIRSSSRSRGGKKDASLLPLLGLLFLVLGYVFYPLIRLAISRKREYLADAGSVLLTHDNQAMISALRKISGKPYVHLENEQMSAMFIANPLKKVNELFQTHPSIENRIKALESY